MSWNVNSLAKLWTTFNVFVSLKPITAFLIMTWSLFVKSFLHRQYKNVVNENRRQWFTMAYSWFPNKLGRGENIQLYDIVLRLSRDIRIRRGLRTFQSSERPLIWKTRRIKQIWIRKITHMHDSSVRSILKLMSYMAWNVYTEMVLVNFLVFDLVWFSICYGFDRISC